MCAGIILGFSAKLSVPVLNYSFHQGDQIGRILAHFFRGISWKNDFSKLFPWKIQFFPNIFWGKFSAEFSPEKMYEKSAPDWANFRPLGDCFLRHFFKITFLYHIFRYFSHKNSNFSNFDKIWVGLHIG
jgi:hypothetical protein